jgi:hypothetical protein
MGLGLAASASQAAPPAVKIEYSASRDALCALLPGSSIKEEWKSELASRQAELVRIWESEGPALLAAVERITGKEFPPDAVTARLTLCNTPSESAPQSGEVTVNMRFALASFARSPVSLRYKSQTLFHELLHRFLYRHPVRDSPLLRQHAGEPGRVLGHLHLLALQKAVLLQQGLAGELKEVVATDSALPGGFYKRAWELVDSDEGEYLKYVAELSK